MIGLELGSVWARLGSKVTVIEFTDTIVPSMDAELRRPFQRTLQKQGVNALVCRYLMQSSSVLVCEVAQISGWLCKVGLTYAGFLCQLSTTEGTILFYRPLLSFRECERKVCGSSARQVLSMSLSAGVCTGQH